MFRKIHYPFLLSKFKKFFALSDYVLQVGIKAKNPRLTKSWALFQ